MKKGRILTAVLVIMLILGNAVTVGALEQQLTATNGRHGSTIDGNRQNSTGEPALKSDSVISISLTAMSTEGIDLQWDDLQAEKYELYRDERLIKTISDCQCRDVVGRTMGKQYRYQVRGLVNGEWTQLSEALTIVYNPFSDVEEETVSFAYIAWAYNNGIVNGMSGYNNIFSPQGNCERMNFCIMLWKMVGKPSPGKKTPFKDLKGLSTNNVKAITWCYNQKIVAGYTKTQFKPHNNITRAQLAIMIWKFAGKPSVEGMTCPYTDIEVTTSFTANNRKAVIWCYNKGLIDSITGDKFEPDLKGTRALLTEMLYGYDEWFSDPYGQRQEIAVNSATPGIKMIGGRRIETEEAIYLDYCCSGIEFNADCRRKLVFNLTVSENCMFKIYIDEQLYQNGDSDYFTVEQGGGKLIVFVEEGLHNIRLVKVSHYRMALAELDSIVINGDILLPAPTEKEPFIEYIGDSLVCGWGVVGLHNGEYLSCDGTLAYPYLVSKALNADYAIFDMSGQGAYYGNPSIQDCYLKSSYRRGDEEYDFPRQADAVVINIGTNDYTYNTGEENFHAALANIIAMVRQKHGDNVKILIVYNMKNDGYSSVLVSFAQQQGISILKCARSTNTATFRHPSIAEHAQYAEEITEVLKELLNL